MAVVVEAAECSSSVISGLDVGMVEIRGRSAVGAPVGRGRLAFNFRFAILVLRVGVVIVELPRKLLEVLRVLGEDGVHGQVDVAVGADAAELLRNVVDDGLAAIVELRLP